MANVWTLEAPPADLTIDDLYIEFGKAIDLAEATKEAWHPRSVKRLEAAINDLRVFVAGSKTTPDVKGWFYATSVDMGLEIVTDELQQAAIYTVTEAAHAAAHLGHLATAMNRAGKVNSHFARLQVAYVLFGIKGVQRYAEMVIALAAEAKAVKKAA